MKSHHVLELLLLSSGVRQWGAHGKCVEESPVDVLIIGAGMSGVSAARRIHEVDADISYVVLEAQDYIGGRMRSHKFGNHTVDEGANWIVGTRGKMTNPIFEIAEKIGLETEVQDYYNWETYNNKGKRIPDKKQDAKFQRLFEAWKCLDKAALDLWYEEKGATDVGAVAQLEKCGWRATWKQRFKNAVQWTYIDWDFADRDTSLLSMPDTLADYFGPTSLFVKDQRGYQAVAEYEAYRDPKTAKDDLNILLNMEVVKVVWDDSTTNPKYPPSQDGKYPAVVYANDAKGKCHKFLANKIISTLSIGCLERISDKLFLPAIPNMNKNPFEARQYVKIFYQFPKKFWGNREYIVFALGSSKRGMCTNWQSYDTGKSSGKEFLPDSNILVCTMVTQALFKLAPDGKLSDDDLYGLLDPLRKAFKNKFVEPVDRDHIYYTDFYNNPYFAGAYGNWMKGKTYYDFEEFFAPRKNSKKKATLYLSGAASCLEFWELTTGAYYGGIKTANLVLEELGVKKIDTSSICDGE